MSHTLIDLTGLPFDSWTVIERGPNNHHGHPRWWCRCVCGTIRLIAGGELRGRRTQSCGCLHKNDLGNRTRTHGKKKTPEYMAWNQMIQRCENPDDPRYINYGARGIRVCFRWRESFEAFYTDMGPRPSSKHSLERKLNDLGYSPENCIWATATMQARNRRTNVLLTYNGVTACLSEWSIITGLKRATLAARKYSGWSDEKTLTMPISVSCGPRPSKSLPDPVQGQLL